MRKTNHDLYKTNITEVSPTVKFADINPFVRYADVHNMTDWNKLRVTRSYDCRFFFVLSGAGEVTLGGNEYRICGGTLMLLTPGTPYSFGGGSFRMQRINFDFTRINAGHTESYHTCLSDEFDERSIAERIRFEDCHRFDHPLCLYGMQAHETELSELMTLHHAGRDAQTSGMMKVLLGELARGGEPDDESASGALEQITRFIHQNYRKRITNADICREANYHPYYLNRLMLSHTGTTIHQYLMSYRLNAAMNLLSGTRLSLTEIAVECGFDSLAHFSACFRAKTGVSPSAYRGGQSKPRGEQSPR